MNSITGRVTHAASLLGFGAALAIGAASLLGFAQPVPAPRPTLVQYATLTKTGNSQTFPPPFVTFEFADRNNRYSGDALRLLLKSRAPVVGDDAAIVNAISDLGWELISHSTSSIATNPVLNNVSSISNSEKYISESWWFKRR